MAHPSFLFLISLTALVAAQSFPPLQWLNLTPLLTGAAPPPLKDSSIGYDESSRNLIVFGGESESGLATKETFLLNLDTLTWSMPNPPSNLDDVPPARSAAVAGSDFAASNRHGFIVIGGKDSDGNPLSDVWEFDFNNQFWSQVSLSPGGPSARWGATGGIDPRVSGVQDPILPGPNNSFYYAGGFSNQPQPLSDIWKLKVSGTLSSNLPNAVSGSWQHLKLDTLPSTVNMAGTIVSQQIVIVGGCADNSNNDTCAQQQSFIIDTSALRSKSPGNCPAPRKSAVLSPNMNTASTSFSNQVFLMLGNFNDTLWQDGGNLQKGEVDILDTNTGTWSRILPSGDPGSSGHVTFPTPREGAAAVSYSLTLVGQSRTIASDTIVFGGRDASGKYLAEVWLLRAYAAVVTASNPNWDGFGNGQLQTGPNATGAGVRNQVVTQCATAIPPSSSSPSPPSSPSGSNSSDPAFPPPQVIVDSFETSFYHKLFSPLSVALFLPVVLMHRATPSWKSPMVVAYSLAVVAYGIGIAGLATSFKSISMSTSTSTLSKRSSESAVSLKTAHGRAGLALFVGLYGLVPIILLARFALCRFRRTPSVGTDELRSSAEKLGPGSAATPSATQSLHSPSRSASPRPRAQSWGPSSLFRVSHEGRLSSDSESNLSSAPHRTFEILNRPPRRQPERLAIPVSLADSSQRAASRSLSDMDWLQRRRSLNAVGELDYAISQALRNQPPSTPATTDVLMAQTKPSSYPQLPSTFNIILHLFFHALLVALCVLSLVALWAGAPTALFAIFLVWTVIFYAIIIALAMNGRPSTSLLSVIIFRLRGHSTSNTSIPSSPHQDQDSQLPFPTTGPYVHHQPPFRIAPDATSTSGEGPRSPDVDGDDGDEDEFTRQRRIEDEMERREVSIVTVPKRRLMITNL